MLLFAPLLVCCRYNRRSGSCRRDSRRTFLRILERPGTFADISINYLYRATRNEALQYCQHREVRERYREYVLADNVSEQVSDPHRQLEYEELQEVIRHTLDKLPGRRLRIFEMHRMEGKKYVEIASFLSLSVKTVEAEMTKALRTLRNEIDNYILTK